MANGGRCPLDLRDPGTKRMLDVTPQERMALTVLAVLLAGGAVARHWTGRVEARQWLEYTAERADTLNPNSNPALRQRAEAEQASARVRETPLAVGERIDPNTASAEQLDRLPRVGPALADRIVAHREASGPFRSLDDLGAVSGIGPALLNGIAELVDLSRAPAASSRAPPSRDLVDINTATAAELDALPGVGPALAASIVAYRAEEGRFRTWDDLEKVSGIGPRLRERIEAEARLGS